MILACNLQLLNIDPWKKGMFLHDALGEAAHACKSILLGPGENWSTQLQMQEAIQLLKGNFRFWLGVGLISQEICVISR